MVTKRDPQKHPTERLSQSVEIDVSPTTHVGNSPDVRGTAVDRDTPLQINKCVAADSMAPQNKDFLHEAFIQLHSLLDRTTSPITNQVVNLSSRVLTQHELSVLSRRLSFCPTPGEPQKGDLVRELEYFQDNLRWEYHFKDNPTRIPPFDKLVMTSKVFKKSNRPSPTPAHKNLEAFIFLNKRDLQQQRLVEPRVKNLTREEKLALISLKKDPFFTIKEADSPTGVHRSPQSGPPQH